MRREWGSLWLRSLAFVSMVKPTDLPYRHDFALAGHLDGAGVRAVHIERQMRSRFIVIRDVRVKNPSRMFLAEDDDMVQAFTPDTSVQPLRVRILPRTARGGGHLLDAHILRSPAKPMAVDGVAITKQVSGGRIPREGFQ